jgi:hypothetical protein
MAKSCNLLPDIIMGKIFYRKTYEWSQYLQAIVAPVCLTILHLTDSAKGTVGEYEMSEAINPLFVVGLLCLSFVTENFSSRAKEVLSINYSGISEAQMMFGANLVGVFITMGSSVPFRWTAVNESLNCAMANPEVMCFILMFGFSGAMINVGTYTAIKVLGSFEFTWIRTTTQLLSVLISVVVSEQDVSPVKLICILTVLRIISSQQFFPRFEKKVADLWPKCLCRKRKNRRASRN